MRKIGTRSQSSFERISVKNALNPILWICGVVGVPSLVMIGYAPNPSWVHITLVIAIVAVALFAYLFFLFSDPDRLQSESYQLRKQALELIEEKGSLAIIEASSIEVISNPDMPALAAPERESEK
jgi:membrane protein YdbS with pleckstrin-like domain